MSKTPACSLYPLTEAGGSVVGGVLAHLMDSSTMEMLPHSPLPRFILVSLTPLPLHPVQSLRTPLP